jgi:4-amino-4-deoxy-L-arabinose transferase-like glycosyltransferase
MENHGGPSYYYAIVLLVGFAPWSIFLAPALRGLRRDPEGDEATSERSAVRFLACWIAVYLLSFTIASTKLPNYILPIYPAVALLTARALERWRSHRTVLASWMLPAGVAGLALVGVCIVAGILVAAGTLPGVPAHRQLPQLAPLAACGLVPVAGAVVAAWCLRRQARTGFVASVVGCGILLTGLLASLGPVAVDRYKAPRALAAALPADQADRDVRVGALDYFQPSLVFYCQREVQRLPDEHAARELLEGPLPAFVFVPAGVWESLHTRVAGRELARHHDLYDARDIVLVTNQ